MTTQTLNAVREACGTILDDLAEAAGIRAIDPPVLQSFDRELAIDAIIAFAALDSRAGDAGEGKAYRCRGCGWRGSEPIANGHPQNGCDLELMVHDPIATPAPAVDAVPAGEVRIPRDVATLIDQAFLPSNPSKMRSAAPEVVEAAKTFKAILATPAPAVDAVPAGEGVEEPDWLNAATCIENMQIAYDNALEADPFGDGNPIPTDTVVDAGDLGVLIGLARYAAALSHGGRSE